MRSMRTNVTCISFHSQNIMAHVTGDANYVYSTTDIVQICMGIIIFVFSFWILHIFVGCRRIPLQVRAIYGNLMVCDVLFGVHLLVTVLMRTHLVPAIICIIHNVLRTHSVHFLTLTLTCFSRFYGVRFGTDFIPILSKGTTATFLVAVWSFGLMASGSAVSDGYKKYSKCVLSDNVGRLGSVTAFIFLASLAAFNLFLLLLITYYRMIRQYKGIDSLVLFGTSQSLFEHAKISCVEMVVRFVLVLMYIPMSVWLFLLWIHFSEKDQTEYHVNVEFIMDTVLSIKVVTTCVLCCVRFVEFRTILLMKVCLCRTVMYRFGNRNKNDGVPVTFHRESSSSSTDSKNYTNDVLVMDID